MLKTSASNSRESPDLSRRVLLISGWLFLAYLVYAQCLPAFDYSLGVRMGTQEPASAVTEVGVAYWHAFAFADVIVYAPLLLLGLIGHARRRYWGRVLLAAGFGITIYWTVTSLAAVVLARDAPGWQLSNERDYWIALPLIALWGCWGLVTLIQEN